MPQVDNPDKTNIFDLQNAIDIAAKEKIIVSFLCQLSNKEIRETDVNWKKCIAHKRFPEDKIVFVCLESIQDKIFG